MCMEQMGVYVSAASSFVIAIFSIVSFILALKINKHAKMNEEDKNELIFALIASRLIPGDARKTTGTMIQQWKEQYKTIKDEFNR